jgi:hypothetical protein
MDARLNWQAAQTQDRREDLTACQTEFNSKGRARMPDRGPAA